MPMVEGNIPLALPGGQANASRPDLKPREPLVKRTQAANQVAFMDHAPKHAFHKASKRGFGGG